MTQPSRAGAWVPVEATGPVPGRHLTRAVVATVVVGLLATQVCHLVVNRAIGSHAWSRFFYLRWLSPVVLIVLACRVIMPRDTVGLYRRTQAHRVGAMWL